MSWYAFFRPCRRRLNHPRSPRRRRCTEPPLSRPTTGMWQLHPSLLSGGHSRRAGLKRLPSAECRLLPSAECRPLSSAECRSLSSAECRPLPSAECRRCPAGPAAAPIAQSAGGPPSGQSAWRLPAPRPTSIKRRPRVTATEQGMSLCRESRLGDSDRPAITQDRRGAALRIAQSPQVTLWRHQRRNVNRQTLVK